MDIMKPELRQRISGFIDRNKALFLLSYFAIYLPWFGHLEKTVTTHFHVIHTALDDYIPFCEYFIIPYLLWFGYVGWGIGYFYLKDRSEYFRLCAMLFTGMTIFLIVSTIYPNGHYLRPTTFARDNIFVHIVKWMYASDTATNSCIQLDCGQYCGMAFRCVQAQTRNALRFRHPHGEHHSLNHVFKTALRLRRCDRYDYSSRHVHDRLCQQSVPSSGSSGKI